MIKYKKLEYWSDQYWSQINRNIGFLKYSEQEKLRTASIGIFGIGGLGGPLVDQLVRAGCENIMICDNDKFDSSNLNRQICTNEDINRFKVDVIEDYMKKINSEIKIIKYYEVGQNNITSILKNLNVIVLALDDLIASILITRECKKRDIPVLESWAVPCLWSWWFTSESMDYERCYGLKTHNMTIAQILKDKKQKSHTNELFLPKIFQIPGIKELYDREPGFFNEMMAGTLAARSFSPVVRLCASFLALDLIFAGILQIKKKILAPQILGYDYIRFKLIEFNMK